MAVFPAEDCLTAVVEVPHLAASKSAFVAWTGASDLMVWGDPLAGGDASNVQEWESVGGMVGWDNIQP